MFDIFGALQNMQQQMESSKKELDTIEVSAESGDGAVQIRMNANKKVLNISINPQVVNAADIEELEDLLLVALNRAADKAEAKATENMQKVAGNMMPPGFNIPGLF